MYYQNSRHFTWDVVTYPVVDGEEIAPAVNAFLVGIPATSSKKEQALQLIHVLLSEEIQVRNARYGLPSVLEEEIWREAFGTGDEAWSGVHADAFFPDRPEGRHEPELDTSNPFRSTDVFAQHLHDFPTFVEQIKINLTEHRSRLLEAGY